MTIFRTVLPASGVRRRLFQGLAAFSLLDLAAQVFLGKTAFPRNVDAMSMTASVFLLCVGTLSPITSPWRKPLHVVGSILFVAALAVQFCRGFVIGWMAGMHP